MTKPSTMKLLLVVAIFFLTFSTTTAMLTGKDCPSAWSINSAIYRVVRSDESCSGAGLVPRKYGGRTTLVEHVALGSKNPKIIDNSPFISFTSDLNMALDWAEKRGNDLVMVEYDRKAIEECEAYDLANYYSRLHWTHAEKNPSLGNQAEIFAYSSCEVLLKCPGPIACKKVNQ